MRAQALAPIATRISHIIARLNGSAADRCPAGPFHSSVTSQVPDMLISPTPRTCRAVRRARPRSFRSSPCRASSSRHPGLHRADVDLLIRSSRAKLDPEAVAALPQLAAGVRQRDHEIAGSHSPQHGAFRPGPAVRPWSDPAATRPAAIRRGLRGQQPRPRPRDDSPRERDSVWPEVRLSFQGSRTPRCSGPWWCPA